MGGMTQMVRDVFRTTALVSLGGRKNRTDECAPRWRRVTIVAHGCSAKAAEASPAPGLHFGAQPGRHRGSVATMPSPKTSREGEHPGSQHGVVSGDRAEHWVSKTCSRMSCSVLFFSGLPRVNRRGSPEQFWYGGILPSGPATLKAALNKVFVKCSTQFAPARPGLFKGGFLLKQTLLQREFLPLVN